MIEIKQPGDPTLHWAEGRQVSGKGGALVGKLARALGRASKTGAAYAELGAVEICARDQDGSWVFFLTSLANRR